MPNIVPAAAEGMSEINRRRLLGGIALASAASAVAGGSAALAATHEPPVHPLERLHALHDEASELMAVHNEYMGGNWELRVRAPDDRCPVTYMNLSAVPEKTPREQAIWHLRELERLAQEDGGWDATVIVIAKYSSNQDCRMISIRPDGQLRCDDNMFAPKGGAK